MVFNFQNFNFLNDLFSEFYLSNPRNQPCFLIFCLYSWHFSIQSKLNNFTDLSNCSSDSTFPGSRYTCKSHQNSCSTYLIYRANEHFNRISNISQLFLVHVDELLRTNRLSSASEILGPGREVLVPVNCSCIGKFFQAYLTYIVSENTNISNIACVVFESLVKSKTLFDENPFQENDIKVGSKLDLPLRCACPNNFSNGVIYLVTYPLVEGDTLPTLSQKFGISIEDLWAANSFGQWTTVYPDTTVLIPLKKHPKIDLNIPNSPPPTPGFLPTITVEKPTNKKLMNLYISVSVIGVSLIVTAMVASVWYVRILFKKKIEKLQSFNTRSSPLSCSTARSSAFSCLSPDLLAGIKYSLKHFSIEELKRATKNFSEETQIGDLIKLTKG